MAVCIQSVSMLFTNKEINKNMTLPLHSGGSLLHTFCPEQCSLLSPTSEYGSGPLEESQL